MYEITNHHGKGTGVFIYFDENGRERRYQPQVSKSPGRKRFGPGTAKNYNERACRNGFNHYHERCDENGWNAPKDNDHG